MTCVRTYKIVFMSISVAIGLMLQTQFIRAQSLETLTVAGGCFWCVEADFEKVNGVVEATPGFTGGSVKNPTYKQVVKGGTGHIEAVQIKFNPNIVSLDKLLNMFFRSIDPTDAGGQFCDRGQSYTTAIFATPTQVSTANLAKTEAQNELGTKVITPVLLASDFYPADAGHQNYYKQKRIVLTRFGPKTKASAYKAYRKACGRDARVKELWGTNAPFSGN